MQLLRKCITKLKGDSTIEACAIELGLSGSTVRRVLAGHGFPSLETVDVILCASGLDIIKAIR